MNSGINTNHWLLPTDLFLRGTGTVHPFRVIGVSVTVEEAIVILPANAGPFTADSLTCQRERERERESRDIFMCVCEDSYMYMYIMCACTPVLLKEDRESTLLYHMHM